ncbi:MAG: aldehyde ferredoxin oxidoreductase family protein [Chloroflexi bacterium]|nr:aldehyde ferredoxin oxidoreductase family protein [Chloroflexota bacterium]
MNGYTGKVLNVDLSVPEASARELDSDLAQRYIGGMGWGTRIVYDEVGPDVDPLGPDNVVVIAAGPLTGTHAPCAGRVDITARSPQTGLLATGNSGGWWGAELKRAGYDAVVLRGRSPRPVYLWVDDGRVEIRSAHGLSGRDTWETSDVLRHELGEQPGHEVRVLACGPAAENRVKFACLINEYYHAQGRCGIGAVLGAKGVKAIAVRGTGEITVAQPEAFDAAVKEAMRRLTTSWHPGLEAPHRAFGSVGVLDVARRHYFTGTLPGRNYQGVVPAEWLEKVTLEAALPHLAGKAGTCYRCPIACFNLAEVRDGKYAGLRIASSTFVAPLQEFGAKCGVLDLPAIWKCKEACHRLGLDMTSAASTIAFAMELYQRGILTRGDTGVDLTWGNDEAILEMLHNIAFRKGLGDLLAEGSLAAARRIGPEALKYAMTVKGLEVFVPDPRRAATLWNLGVLASPRGGDNIKTTHTRVDRLPPLRELKEKHGLDEETYTAGYVASLDMTPAEKLEFFGDPPRLDEFGDRAKPALAKWMSDLCSAMNCLIVCIFPTTHLNRLGPSHYARLLSAATGMEVTPAQLMRTGERVLNLQRMYLARCGITRQQDDWPARFYDEGLPQGSAAGSRLDRKRMTALLEEYYRIRGWDPQSGLPTETKLKELGLA